MQLGGPATDSPPVVSHDHGVLVRNEAAACTQAVTGSTRSSSPFCTPRHSTLSVRRCAEQVKRAEGAWAAQVQPEEGGGSKGGGEEVASIPTWCNS